VQNLAQILVDHSVEVEPGDRVLVEATTAAEPLVRALYVRILERGGYPHLLLALPDEDELLFAHGQDAQLDFVPTFRKLAYETFESRIRIHSVTNTYALSEVDPQRQARRQRARSQILKAQMDRGAEGAFKWVTTLFPTEAFAMQAGMGCHAYKDFVYRACHADEETPDPVGYWRQMEAEQQRIVECIQGHDKVELRGPNVDLTLSIAGRTFVNGSGRHNIPDGEIYTGPVEDSLNGWVRFTYPTAFQGRIVEGVELTFVDGRVSKARADKGEDFLLQLIETDAGARYVGEFAIGTNFEIDRFTGSILLDEKIGGSFHFALGRGYPETGSCNDSAIHWDMICDLQTDSEIVVDGEVIYRNGSFVF
jgi:aminopeptidase